MKKISFGLKAIAAGTAVMAVLAMGACGGDDKPTQSANGELSGELSVWGWGNGMKELAEAFEAANPGGDRELCCTEQCVGCRDEVNQRAYCW